MAKDTKYLTAKKLIIRGDFNTFRDIFDVLPKTIMAKDLGMNNTKFTRMMKDVMWIKMGEILRMAELLEVEEYLLTDLIWKQYELDNRGRKKKPNKI